MRRAATVVAGLMSLLGLAFAPAYADEAILPGTVSTSDVSTRTVLLPVPDGVVLRRLVGQVRVDSGAGPAPRGRLEVLVGDEVVETLSSRARSTFRTEVRRSDLDAGGFLEVGLRWAAGCAPAGVSATLDDLRLVHGGQEPAPRTEREFLGPGVTRVDVVVPRSATDDVLEAALESVALLTRHYGDRVPVSMSTVDTVLPRVGLGQRVLRLEPGDTLSRGIEQRFGLWTLVLRGPGASVRNTVRDALGPPPESPLPAESQTLADLGASVDLGGWGTSSATVDLPQDLFGGVVDGLDVHLTGSHTAIPDGTLARFDVRVDDTLLESVDLTAGDGTRVDLDLDVPPERLRAGSTLQVLLTTVPADGCAGAAGTLPIELDLDPELSTVTAGRGDSDVEGLRRLPATLDGELAVASRATGAARAEAAAAAGAVVAALQRTAGLPLDVSWVTPDALVTGDEGGLLVAADPTDAVAVQAPVRLEPGGGVEALSDEEGFAVLQAVQHRGRDLLVLGSWAPRGTDTAALTRRLVAQVLADGWGSLDGGALVQQADGAAVVVGPATPAPPATPPGAGSNPYAPYLLGAAALLVLLLVVQVGLVIRRDRRLRGGALSPGRPRQQP